VLRCSGCRSIRSSCNPRQQPPAKVAASGRLSTPQHARPLVSSILGSATRSRDASRQRRPQTACVKRVRILPHTYAFAPYCVSNFFAGSLAFSPPKGGQQSATPAHIECSHLWRCENFVRPSVGGPIAPRGGDKKNANI
jgi:hypothetical protein